MRYLIIDTSSILFALSNKTDLFKAVKAELPSTRILISQGVVRELGKMAGSRAKNAKFARVAISLLNSYNNIEIEQDSSYVDGWILKTAQKVPCAVCTNDIKLKKALKAKGVRVYSISRDGSLR